MTEASFRGVGATALELLECFDGNLELAAVHAVSAGRELMELDPEEGFKLVRIGAMLQGQEVEEVGHA